MWQRHKSKPMPHHGNPPTHQCLYPCFIIIPRQERLLELQEKEAILVPVNDGPRRETFLLWTTSSAHDPWPTKQWLTRQMTRPKSSQYYLWRIEFKFKTMMLQSQKFRNQSMIHVNQRHRLRQVQRVVLFSQNHPLRVTLHN